MKKFTVSEAIGFGWRTFKAHWQLLLVIGLIYLFANAIPNITPQILASQGLVIRLIATVVAWILSIILSIGIIYISLKFVDGQAPGIGDLFSQTHAFVKYVLAQLLVIIILFIGFVLLVVPGLIFLVRLQFVSYAVVDKGLGPVGAVKYSWQITGGSFWNLSVFNLATWLLMLGGILVFGIGVFVAIPVTFLAMTHVYRKLSL